MINLRSAVERSNTTVDLVKKIRSERLSAIKAGETPVLLGEDTSKIVLHMIPESTLNVSNASLMPNITPLMKDQQLIEPFSYDFGTNESLNEYRYRYNFDGVISSIEWRGKRSSYTQFFRHGVIEAVDVSILARLENKMIPGQSVGTLRSYEYCLCEALARYIRALQTLQVEAPIFVMVSLLGVQGYKMSTTGHRHYGYQEPEIDRSDLVVPEIELKQFDCDSREVMKPIFDIIWNAAGHARSANYDNAGKSTLPQQM